MTTIALTHNQWSNIKDKIYAEVPLSVKLITSKHKEVLGFTVREHQGDFVVIPADLKYSSLPSSAISANFTLTDVEYLDYIALDFVNEAAATMFRLRWL